MVLLNLEHDFLSPLKSMITSCLILRDIWCHQGGQAITGRFKTLSSFRGKSNVAPWPFQLCLPFGDLAAQVLEVNWSDTFLELPDFALKSTTGKFGRLQEITWAHLGHLFYLASDQQQLENQEQFRRTLSLFPWLWFCHMLFRQGINVGKLCQNKHIASMCTSAIRGVLKKGPFS